MRSTPSRSPRSSLYEGAFWLLLGSGGQKLLGWASGIALARLLAPRQFGVFALAALVYEAAALFEGVGAVQYVVAAENPEPNLEAAHRLNLAAALALAVVLAALAPAAAAFFHQERLAALVPVLALSLPLGAMGAVQGALAERELRLAELARRRLAVNLAAVLLMVGLAAAGLGVWALILPVPLRSAAGAWLNRRLHPWRPRRPGWNGARDVIRYGRHIVGERLASYLSDQMDNAAVGRVLGPHALGIYDFAYQAAMMPLKWGADLASRLAFPALAFRARSRSGDSPVGERDFLEAVGWMAFVAGPLVAGMVVIAGDWVRVLYGVRWTPTVPLIRILAPAALVVLCARPSLVWLQAAGHEAWPARIRIASLPLVALALALSVGHGVVAVAAAMAAVLVVEGLAMMAAALRAGAAGTGAWLRALWWGLSPSLIMLLVLATAARGLDGAGSSWTRLAVLLPLGVVVFVAAAAVLARSRLVEIARLLRHRSHGDG